MSRMRNRRLAHRERVSKALESKRVIQKIFAPVWSGDPARLIKGDIRHCILEFDQIYGMGINPSSALDDKINGLDRRKTPAKCLPGEFPVGSILKEEGQFLYALTRYLNPDSVLEIGTWFGCSATHIASALDDLKSPIKILAIDNAFDGVQIGFDSGDFKTIGSMIPDNLRKYVEIRIANMEEVLPDIPDESVDLIFEDSAHTYYTTYYAAIQAKRILKPGGFMAIHDIVCAAAGVFFDGTVAWGMQKAFKDAGMLDEMNIFLINPSDMGVGIWRKSQ